mmetsp:Transcript_20665/g.60043  ORF Transcript_20665/g.60043 Transcript_20665/m.60043 type:complete len:313 (+) Transcript_20665:1483-2421(+)
MTQIDAFPDLTIYLLVRLLVEKVVLSLVLHRDQQREQMRVDQLKERVHVDEMTLGEGGDLVEHSIVQMFAGGGGDGIEAVVRDADVFVTIDLEEVASPGVDDEAADPERMIVLELQNLLRITQCHDQFLLRPVERQLIERRLMILRQRIIHIEPYRLDAVQIQFAIAKDVVRAQRSLGRQIVQLGQSIGESHGGEEGVVTPSRGEGGVDVRRVQVQVRVDDEGRLIAVGRCRFGFGGGQRTIGEELLRFGVLVDVVGGEEPASASASNSEAAAGRGAEGRRRRRHRRRRRAADDAAEAQARKGPRPADDVDE